MIYRDPKRCELCFDVLKRGHKACRGTVIRVAGVRLCLRHRKILDAIVADANQAGRRHPVHHGRYAA